MCRTLTTSTENSKPYHISTQPSISTINMPPQRDAQVDDTSKNRIYHLYIMENLSLTKVRSTMKSIFDFDRTLNEYQKLLHDWKFEKRKKTADWRDLKRKIDARKAVHKQSALYLNRKLLPDHRVNKEFGRQSLFMNAMETFKANQEPMPATPPGFMICTPDAEICLNYVFKNLPILKFIEIARSLTGATGSLLQFSSEATSLVPFFATSSILPPSAFLTEKAATALGLDKIDRLDPTELVNLVTYMISNNLPGTAKSSDMYKLLKARGMLDLLSSIASVDSLTTEALLEGIFRLAMEALDTPIVKELLRLRVNPNGYQFVYDGIADTFDALQYSCLRGAIELARILLEAGIAVNDGEMGWKRSILTIAIVGNYGSLWGTYLKVEDRAFNYKRYDKTDDEEEMNPWDRECDDINVEHEEALEGNDCICDYHSLHRKEPLFVELVESLLRAGAKVVYQVDDSEFEDESTLDQYMDNVPHAFKGCDSPLTAAAKYKRQYLVDRFLDLGADANLTLEPGDSAIHQCLLSFEENLGDPRDTCFWEWTLPDLRAWILARATFKSFGCNNITGIVKSLLRANADPDQPYVICDNFSALDEKYHAYQDATPLNFAILGSFEELVEVLLSSGSNPNRSSLEYAIHGGNRAILERILDTNAPLSYQAIRAAAELPRHGFFELLVTKRTDHLSRTLAVIEAVRSDIGEDVLDLENFDPVLLRDHLSQLQDAVNHCCSIGRTGFVLKLLNSQCASRVSHLPTLPPMLPSVAEAGTWELWGALMKMIENAPVVFTASLDPPVFSLEQSTNRQLRATKVREPLRENEESREPVGSSPTSLHISVEQGNITQVRRFLEQQEDPNFVPAGLSHTPLQIAARDGHKEIAELLLQYGANVNGPPCAKSGATALQYAAIGGYIGIAAILLEYRVDIDAAGAQSNGRTALEGAAEHGRIDMLKMFLNAGADVHGAGQIQYERALNFASNNGHHAARKMLEDYHNLASL
ncbi:hypothetical protein VTL71DRAFT_4801 [Oculimacula yallundae]|uniref:Clr5 domain-containing protein n=1 Tax=Oculimacula yallundae TaxID=86028 RepID=A0ABR4C469_9HELO